MPTPALKLAWRRAFLTRPKPRLRRAKRNDRRRRNRRLACRQFAGPHVAELPEFDDALHETYNSQRKASKEKLDQEYVEIQLRRWK